MDVVPRGSTNFTDEGAAKRGFRDALESSPSWPDAQTSRSDVLSPSGERREGARIEHCRSAVHSDIKTKRETTGYWVMVRAA